MLGCLSSYSFYSTLSDSRSVLSYVEGSLEDLGIMDASDLLQLVEEKLKLYRKDRRL